MMHRKMGCHNNIVLTFFTILILFGNSFGQGVTALDEDNILGRKCGPCICYETSAKCVNKRLTYIPTFSPNVTVLIFNGNNLPSINLTTFSNLSSLNIKQLQLRQNHIVNISKDAFSMFPLLKVLDLGRNTKLNLTCLTQSLGSVSKSSLRTLKLDSIKLNDTFRIFKQMTGSNVTEIDVSRNELRNLDLKEFEGMEKLTDLDIRKNGLQNIFLRNVSLPELEDIVLAENELNKFPSFCSGPLAAAPRLQKIDISYNYLKSIKPNGMNCLHRLGKLSLDMNVIYKWTNNVFSKLNNLKTLQMAAMRTKIKSIDPYAFNSSSIQKLIIRDNHIIFSHMEFRREIFKHSPNLESLDLSNNLLRHSTQDDLAAMLSPLQKLEKLWLVNTKLSSLKGLFTELSRLSHLYVDNNNLKNIDGLFNEVPSLQYLTLQNNNIHAMTKDSFPDAIASNLTLNLANNPFYCTCDLLWFKTFIGNSGKVGRITLINWPSRYQCTFPPSMYKRTLQSYNPTVESCEKALPLTIVLVPTAVFVIVVFLVTFAVYRNRWYIRYWRYRLIKRLRNVDPEEQPLLDGVVYDAYVIYNDDDAQFVHGEFLRFMEEKLMYKLFIWHRNAAAGLPAVDAMADGVYASHNVLAIVTNNLLKDNWCKFQLDVCVNKQIDDGRELVNLVLMDGLDYKTLNRDWCVLLTKLKSTRWCQDDNSVKGNLFIEDIRKHMER